MPNRFLRLYSQFKIRQNSCLCKSHFFMFYEHFSKNKKHTNFYRCLNLYRQQKLNEKKPERRSLYKPKLSHFYNIVQKVAIARNASNKKPSSRKTLHVTMAILISFSSSKNPLSPYYHQITLQENAHEE